MSHPLPEPHQHYQHAALPPTTPRAGGRRPGWAALALATAASAVLASSLTAGAVTALDHGGSRPATSMRVPSSSGSAPARATTIESLDWTTVAAAVSPSVVSIQVTGNGVSGSGSGVVLDGDGHILTNNHVATAGGMGESLQVRLSDGRVFDNITVVGLDAATDLAVLQISKAPDDLAPAAFGDSDTVVAGQPVMAVGNPLGLTDSVTTGIVSAVDRPVTTASSHAAQVQQPTQRQRPQSTDAVVTNAIQTDAAVNPGNSGGALVDAAGQVIGIPSSIASTATGSQEPGSIGLGFAIPANEAKRIADEIIASGSAAHAWLGVSASDGTATADGTTRQGATLAEVVGDGPAATAGLTSGDVVVSVDGELVSGAESLTAQIRQRSPGDVVTLGVIGDGAAREVAVTLAAKGA